MGMTVKDLSTNKLLVSPSVLAADFSRLDEEIKRVDQGGCDLIHLDVMDGHFVPNLTMGPPLIKSIRKSTNLVFDTHLMITDPMKYAEVFVNAGADHITFHVEGTDAPIEQIIDHIKSLNVSVGLSLKPGTPAEAVFPYLDKIDLVLVMTVEPGFGGQSFMADMMPKVKAIKDEIKRRNLNVHLEVDGGLDAKTITAAAKAGANMIVAGTSVFRNPDGVEKAIQVLHDAEVILY